MEQNLIHIVEMSPGLWRLRFTDHKTSGCSKNNSFCSVSTREEGQHPKGHLQGGSELARLKNIQSKREQVAGSSDHIPQGQYLLPTMKEHTLLL